MWKHTLSYKKILEKIGILLSYDACSIIIHTLIDYRLDYCNPSCTNVPHNKRVDYKEFRINMRASG